MLHVLRELGRLLPPLSPEHQAVVDQVISNGLSHIDAAAALEVPEGTVKSRLIAAKREIAKLVAEAMKFLPPSQRD
jgi:DNA-directed RNA polymerase specialized sigma24 family protein